MNKNYLKKSDIGLKPSAWLFFVCLFMKQTDVSVRK